MVSEKGENKDSVGQLIYISFELKLSIWESVKFKVQAQEMQDQSLFQQTKN
jgi:hypothetical protein